MATVKEVQLKNNKIVLSFDFEKMSDLLKVELRLKDGDRFVVPAYRDVFEIDVVHIKENTYEFTMDLDQIMNNFEMYNPNNQFVYFYVRADNEYCDLKVDETVQVELRRIGTIKNNKLATINLLKRKNGTLGLKVNKVGVKGTVDLLRFNEREVVLDVSAIITKTNEQLDLSKLSLKKRSFKDTPTVYSECMSLENKGKNTFSLEIEKLREFSFEDEVTILDFILEVQDQAIVLGADIKKKDEQVVKTFELMDLKFKFYWTKSHGLSIRVERIQLSAIVTSISHNEDKSSVQFVFDQSSFRKISDLRCFVYRKNIVNNDSDIFPYKEITLVDTRSTDNHLMIELNFMEIFKGIDLVEQQNYSLYLVENFSLYKITSTEVIERKTNIHGLNVNMMINSDGTSIVIAEEKPKVLNLGILGTCFTRSAFNSRENYYNPDYKQHFNVAYTHFWPSLLSLSSQPIEFKKDDYKDVKEKDLNQVIREYEKNTFIDLKNANIDYLLVDFFVDAVHGARKLSDGRYLGQNGFMHKSSHYHHWILKNTDQFDYRHPDFWNEWRDSCDAFIKELSQTVDLKRVVLIWGGLTKHYYDSNRQTMSFIKEGKFTNTQINLYNNIWERMNKYFITKAPSVKILDLRKYNYLADVDHTVSFGPHHYESNYYKSFIGELSKLIVNS